MQVGDEVIRLLFMLQVDVLADRAKIIAPVKAAGRLNAGKNAHGKWSAVESESVSVSWPANLKRPHDVAHALRARLGQCRRQRIEDLHRHRRIIEVRRPDLHRRCPGDEKLHHVVDRGDAADADQRRLAPPCAA